MFVLLWGPTVAAVSVVLDHADAGAVVATALGGLMHAARIAAFHHVDEVRAHHRWHALSLLTMARANLSVTGCHLQLQWQQASSCMPQACVLTPHIR